MGSPTQTDFTLGTLAGGQTIQGTNSISGIGGGNDIINAGFGGNDTIRGSTGNDLIDGNNAAENIVSYTGLSSGITVTSEHVNGTLYQNRLEVDKGASSANGT